MFAAILRAASTATVAGIAVTAATLGLAAAPASAQSGGFHIQFGPDGVRFGRSFGHHPADGGPGFRPDRPGFGRGGHPGHGHGGHPGHGRRDNIIGETGIVQVRQHARQQWHHVALRGTYANPVVILGPPTRNGGDPALARVGRVGSRGFDVRIEEWAYLDGSHVTESIGFLVVEAGRHVLPGGAVLRAGIAHGVDEGWRRVRIGGPGHAEPVVLTTVIGRGSGLPVTPRVRNVNRNGFGLRVQKEQAVRNVVFQSRNVAWVAIEGGRGHRDDLLYVAGTTAARVNEQGHPIGPRRPQLTARLPVVLASLQTFRGPDPAALRYKRNRRGPTVFVEEERSRDRETHHANEKVGYALFAPGLIAAASPHGHDRIGDRFDDDRDGRRGNHDGGGRVRGGNGRHAVGPDGHRPRGFAPGNFQAGR